jgi:hypothetical protein
MPEKPLYPEYEVKLTSVEIELILFDLHTHLANLLAYLDHRQKHLAGGPEGWVRARINRLRNLAAKLESLNGYVQEASVPKRKR